MQQLLNEIKISMISLGDKVTDTTYVTGLLGFFLLLFYILTASCTPLLCLLLLG